MDRLLAFCIRLVAFSITGSSKNAKHLLLSLHLQSRLLNLVILSTKELYTQQALRKAVLELFAKSKHLPSNSSGFPNDIFSSLSWPIFRSLLWQPGEKSCICLGAADLSFFCHLSLCAFKIVAGSPAGHYRCLISFNDTEVRTLLFGSDVALW